MFRTGVLRAIGREKVEIRRVRAQRRRLDLVDDLVRAGKRARLFRKGAGSQAGEQRIRGLLLGDPLHQHIAESVEDEAGHVRLPPRPADVYALLHEVLLQLALLREADVVQAQLAVLEPLSVAQRDPLPRRSVDGQPADAGAVLAEIVAPALALTADRDGLELLVNLHRICRAQPLFPARGRHTHRVAERAVVKPGAEEALLLQPRVVDLAAAVIVEQYGRIADAEALVALQLGRAAVRSRQAQAHRKAGRAPPGRLFKVPDRPAGIVLEPVAQQHRDDVFPLDKVPAHVVAVIIDQVVGAADVGRQHALGDVPSVDKQPVKACRRDDDFRLRGLFGRKGLPEKRRRYEAIQVRVRRTRSDKGVREPHGTILLCKRFCCRSVRIFIIPHFGIL